MIPIHLPRVVDLRSCRRPGGSQGAPRPDPDNMPDGVGLVAWLVNGDVVHLDAPLVEYAEGTAPEPDAIAWSAIEWWAPL